MTNHQPDDSRSRRADPRCVAQKAQEISRAASALEARLSGLVSDAPLSTDGRAPGHQAELA
jgi:hypothetical protein